MIYTIKNGKLVKSVAKNGRKFKTQSKRRRERNTQNSKRSHRFYSFYQSTRWKKLSRNIRRNEVFCRQCVKECKAGKRKIPNLATSTDHIVPLKKDWKDRWNPKNLQPLCHYHHVLKDKRGL